MQTNKLALRWALAAAAFTIWAIHASVLIKADLAYEMLWVCNLSGLVIGTGLLTKKSAVLGLGVLWITIGSTAWVSDVLSGVEYEWTSYLNHLGGSIIGLLGVRLMGISRWSWVLNGVFAAMMVGITRLVAPPDGNTNLAFRPWSGFEDVFSSWGLYIVVVITTGTVMGMGVQWMIRRWVVPSKMRMGER